MLKTETLRLAYKLMIGKQMFSCHVINVWHDVPDDLKCVPDDLKSWLRPLYLFKDLKDVRKVCFAKKIKYYLLLEHFSKKIE